MAATIADLTAQLKLNNANFKRGLSDSKRSINGFQKNISNMKRLLIGAFTITAAVATFKKAIASTQGTTDNLARNMGAAKEATTALLSSITTGDWGGLINNMRMAAEAGRDYADAMDEVGDHYRSIRIQAALAEKKVLNLRTIATDTAQQDKDRVAAYKEIVSILSTQINKEQKITEQSLQAQIDKLATRNGLTREQGELLKDYVINYDTLTEKELRATEQVKILRDELSKLNREGKSIALGVATVGADKEKIKEIEQLIKNRLAMMDEQERKYYEISEAINKFTDEERQAIADTIVQGAALERKLVSLMNEGVRGISSIGKAGKAATTEIKALVNQLDGIEPWMTKPFPVDTFKKDSRTASQIGMDADASEVIAALADIAGEDVVGSFDDITESAEKLGTTVGVMLVNQFQSLGYAIGQSLSGVEGSFASLGKSILDNLGSILIMAGLSSTPIGWGLVIAGAAMQLGSGIFGGLGSSVNESSASNYSHNVTFSISGNNLVGVLDNTNDRTNVVT